MKAVVAKSHSLDNALVNALVNGIVGWVMAVIICVLAGILTAQGMLRHRRLVDELQTEGY
jgi:type IV secretory pathway VirB2 component (pilin)